MFKLRIENGIRPILKMKLVPTSLKDMVGSFLIGPHGPKFE